MKDTRRGRGQEKENRTPRDAQSLYEKKLPYADKEGKEDETGNKIAPVRQ